MCRDIQRYLSLRLYQVWASFFLLEKDIRMTYSVELVYK